VKRLQEGKAVFKANLSGKKKGPGKAKGVFYNPAMKFSRDLHVEFAKQFNFNGVMLDALAASGIRGIRLFLEAKVNVEFCDNSALAVKTISENLGRNGIQTAVYHRNVEDLLSQMRYDWIDIDPFGTPLPFLESALICVKENGILGISATDTAVLCGAKPSICKKRYGATSMKKVVAKEVGIRILIGKIHEIAFELDKGIQPLLSYSEGHHLRTFVRITPKRKDVLGWITEDMDTCANEKKGAGGPLWTGKITQKQFVPRVENRILGKFLDILREESEGPPGLYDINDLAKMANLGQTPKKIKIVKCIRKLGFFASPSVFSPIGIKTDAPTKTRIEALKLAQSL
tara:strand:- start:4864 stop:5895 length:1032 start_codon:yes stop_codon:yes gene_type:complete